MTKPSRRSSTAFARPSSASRCARISPRAWSMWSSLQRPPPPKRRKLLKAPPPQSGPRPILLLPRRKRCRRFLQKNRPVWMPSAPQKGNAVKETQSAHTAALQDISNARTGALDDVAASTKMATDAASTAVQKAAAAAGSASNAAESEKNAKASANAAQEHQTGAEAAQKKAEDAADRAAATVSTDKTLTVENAPADAKAVGEALKNLNIRPATSTTLGGIKVGSGLSVADDGTLSADAQEYTPSSCNDNRARRYHCRRWAKSFR